MEGGHEGRPEANGLFEEKPGWKEKAGSQQQFEGRGDGKRPECALRGTSLGMFKRECKWRPPRKGRV
eukprot:4874961-Pleurochrysis_carterae.AAC.1